jgi:hypothetical protein
VLSESIVSASREEGRRYELPDEFVVLGFARQLEQFGVGQHVGTVARRDIEGVAGVQDLFAAVGVLDPNLPGEYVAPVLDRAGIVACTCLPATR